MFLLLIWLFNYDSQINISEQSGEGVETDVITPGDFNVAKDINIKDVISKNSYVNKRYLENLVLNWNKLLDIFTTNISFYHPSVGKGKSDFENVSRDFLYPDPTFIKGNEDEFVNKFSELVKQECDYYKLDWRLILAMVRQESYFNPEAVSRSGAFGFMQLMPGTGSELRSKLRLENTNTPENNLIAGIYYYAYLIAMFQPVGEDKYQFALAAYNAGLGRVIDAMSITAYMEKDYYVWENVSENLRYLSSDYDSIHSVVWPDLKKPRYGILNNWIEPYLYVKYIMYYYNEYKKYYPSNLPEKKTIKDKKKKK